MQSREGWHDEQRRQAADREAALLASGYDPNKLAAAKAAGLAVGWFMRGGWMLAAVLLFIWLR